MRPSFPFTRASTPRVLLASFAMLLLLGLPGCAARTQMTDVWRDKTVAPRSFHNIMVVAIRKDPVRRRAWEDAFVSALHSRGIKAMASYTRFADAAPDSQELQRAVRSLGCDAVMTSVRLADETEDRYVPGVIRNEPMTRQDYYGRFHRDWVVVQEEGYIETDTVILVRTDLWTPRNGRGVLVWSGTLRTLERASSDLVEEAVTEHIMPLLEKQGMVPVVGQ